MELTLGPIVGHVEPESARIWVRTKKPGMVRLRLFRDAGKSDEAGAAGAVAAEDMGHTVVLTAGGLTADTRYFYDVEDEAGQSLLAPGRRDLSFKTAPDPASTPSFKFGLISCNKPYVGEKATRFDVWKRMRRVFAQEDVRFLILAGDQLYADRTYDRLAKDDHPDPAEVLAGYRREYELQWGTDEIQDVLGRVPCYMIWDDHEINNGWGAHKLDTKAAKRQTIFRGASRAYFEHQHSLNPHTFGAERYYYAFRFGTIGFFVLDLRGHRDSNRGNLPLLGARQWRDFKGWVGSELEGLSALAVVTSVPVVHSPSFVANLVPSSDLRDQWSFRANKPERRSLVRFLLTAANQRDIPVTILSGDIHVGTTARIISERPGHRKRPEVYQFASSPVTNRPSRLIQKLQLATDRVRRIDDGIRGRIHDVLGRRNFGVVEVHADAPGGGVRFRFRHYLEGVDEPKVWDPSG